MQIPHNLLHKYLCSGPRCSPVTDMFAIWSIQTVPKVSEDHQPLTTICYDWKHGGIQSDKNMTGCQE